jgi:predicted permease
VSLVLLAGAGLFVRSLANLAKVNTGFNKQNVLLLKLDPSATGYSDEPHLGNLYQQVEDRVAALPEVRAASFSIVTFNEGGWNDDAWPEGRPDKSFDHTAWYNVVGPGYFATMGLPILSGRGIDRRDTANSPRVAVINETFARRFFPDGLPVGKHFGMDTPEHSHEIEVIGVVRDAKYLRLDEKPTAMAYYPYTQYIPDWGTGLYLRDFEVRFSGAPQTVVSEIHRAIGEVNDDLPVSEVITLAEQVDDSITYPRIVAQLSAFFGLLAVFLACIGIYGLMTYAVARRTNEIGIRMALGASQRDVMAMVLRETLTMVVFGLAIGVPMALVSGRWAASLLFGLKPTDPATLLFAAVVLLAVASFAGYLPARRATQVDPMVALRYE